MKYVKKLTDEELITLESARKYHPISRVRNRAHVIILSHRGYRINRIAGICAVSRYAVSRVIDNWEQNGLRGLYDRPRPGRKRILTAVDEEFICTVLKEEPRSVKKTVAELENRRGKKVSRETVKRIIKKNNLWKRIRKTLKPKRNEKKFRRAEERIKTLERRREKGEVDVFYFDGTGFDLTPSVPYAWQPKGEYAEVPAGRSRRLNVLGFMNKDNRFSPYVFECGIDSDAVTACFDSFSDTVEKKTFVIMDNAPVHRSKKFLSRLHEWHKKGLYPKFLPKYSPELNLIEILWKKIKYEWLTFDAYTSYNILKERVEEILINFGSRYIINFL